MTSFLFPDELVFNKEQDLRLQISGVVKISASRKSAKIIRSSLAYLFA